MSFGLCGCCVCINRDIAVEAADDRPELERSARPSLVELTAIYQEATDVIVGGLQGLVRVATEYAENVLYPALDQGLV